MFGWDTYKHNLIVKHGGLEYCTFAMRKRAAAVAAAAVAGVSDVAPATEYVKLGGFPGHRRILAVVSPEMLVTIALVLVCGSMYSGIYFFVLEQVMDMLAQIIRAFLGIYGVLGDFGGVVWHEIARTWQNYSTFDLIVMMPGCVMVMIYNYWMFVMGCFLGAYRILFNSIGNCFDVVVAIGMRMAGAA
jgi:hypothetical protein